MKLTLNNILDNIKKYKILTATGTHHSGKSSLCNMYSPFNEEPTIFEKETMMRSFLERLTKGNDSIDSVINQSKYLLEYSHKRPGNYDPRRERIGIMDELIRGLSTQSNFSFTPDRPSQYKFGELALLSFYETISNVMLEEMFDEYDFWIFDRCPTDIYGYVKYFDIDIKLKKGGTLQTKILNTITNLMHKGYFNNMLLMLMKPIPIKKSDGFRLDKEAENEFGVAQMGVYETAKSLLELLGLDYIEASFEDATNIIDARMDIIN